MAPRRQQHRAIRVLFTLPQLTRLKALIENEPQQREDMELYLRLKKAHSALTQSPKWPYKEQAS